MRQTLKTLGLILWAAASGYAVGLLTAPARDWSRSGQRAKEVLYDATTGVTQTREQSSETEMVSAPNPNQFDLFREPKGHE